MKTTEIIYTARKHMIEAGYEVTVSLLPEIQEIPQEVLIFVFHPQLKKHYSFNCMLESEELLNSWEQAYEFAFGYSIYEGLDIAV